MTEVEFIESINLHASNGISCFAIASSLTFAYITAAYLVGSKLTKLQVTIVSSIYFTSACAWAFTMITHADSFERLVSIYPDFVPSPLWEGPFTLLSILVTVPAAVASLYFMYDVRKTKPSDG